MEGGKKKGRVERESAKHLKLYKHQSIGCNISVVNHARLCTCGDRNTTTTKL